MLLISLLFLIATSVQAQSSLSTYADDFYEATLHKSTFETLAAPAVTGAFSNYVTQPSGFGSGGEGLGYHYGVSLADNVQGKFLRKFVFAAASGRPDKYCPLGSAVPFKMRIRNVVLHSVFSISQSSRAFNWSALPASLVAATLSDAYQPDQQKSVSATFERFGTNAAGYIFGDFLAEMTFKPKENLTVRIVIGYR
jgi:hypothetical protein